MTRFDLSRLGGWADLPFFAEDLPAIEARLAADPGPVLPPAPLTFAALERTQPERVRAVILGQDPYHTPGKAMGLAFSIPDGFPGRLDSLGNILRELRDDLCIERRSTDLSDWADRGVLLLNTALTVRQGAAGSHVRLGWDRLVAQVLARTEARPTAYLLWGRPAQRWAPRGGGHLVLTAPHPSPLSAHRGFLGSRPFSKVNQWLEAHGEPPLDWS